MDSDKLSRSAAIGVIGVSVWACALRCLNSACSDPQTLGAMIYLKFYCI